VHSICKKERILIFLDISKHGHKYQLSLLESFQQNDRYDGRQKKDYTMIIAIFTILINIFVDFLCSIYSLTLLILQFYNNRWEMKIQVTKKDS